MAPIYRASGRRLARAHPPTVCGACAALHAGTHASNGTGATSAGSMVDIPLEVMTRASDLSTRRAASPLWAMTSQILRSALLDWSCTLEWAHDGTDQCGINASDLISSRLHTSAAALVTVSFHSMCSMPSRAAFSEHGKWSVQPQYPQHISAPVVVRAVTMPLVTRHPRVDLDRTAGHPSSIHLLTTLT